MLEHPDMAELREYLKLMRSLVHGANMVSRWQRYIAAVGAVCPDYIDTRWDSATSAAEHHAKHLRLEVAWISTEVDRSSQGKERPEAKKNTVLQQVSALLSKHCLVLHLQLTFFSEFGKPIYEFITHLQVDIVPKGNSGGQHTPIGHRLFIRVIELVSKLQNWAQDVGLVLGVKPLLDMIRNPALREAHVNSLKHVAQKVLAVIAKYKDKQLPFFDELRVLDPKQRSGMSQDLSSYNNLFDASTQQLLQRFGQWTIYWKLNIVAGADFSLLCWWENASLYMGMPDLADRAITALTLPVTTTVAEGSFRIMEGLLTADCRGMSHDTQIG